MLRFVNRPFVKMLISDIILWVIYIGLVTDEMLILYTCYKIYLFDIFVIL